MSPFLGKTNSMNWRSHFLILRILLTLIILVLVFMRVDIDRIGEAFQSIRVTPFMFAVLLVPVNLLMQMYRWYFILKTADAYTSPKDAFKSILVGLTFGLITPGRIGEVGRSLYIPSSNAIEIVGLVILEKIFSFFTVLITSALGIIVWGHEIAGVIVFVCVLFVAFQLNAIRSILSRISFLLPSGKKVAELWSRWSYFDRKKIVSLFVISICFFLIVYIQFYILVSSFQGIEVTPALISIPLIIAINSIPITVAGLGLREGASVFFFSKFGVAEAAALNGALLLFAIDLLIPGLIGLPFTPKKRFELERLEEEMGHS